MTDSRIFQAVSRLSALAILLLVASQAVAGTTINRPAQTEADAADADPLQVLVDEAIARTRRRFLDADRHTPWQILHGLLALRGEFELNRNGQRVNAIDYISDAARYGGEYWFEATAYGGRAHPFTIPYAFEGHVNQSLALLSMSGLPLDHEFHVRGRRVVTMADMVRNAQMTANTNEETTWTLWFLTNYLDQDEQWLNQNQEPWSMERLVEIQVRSDVTRAPCGGTHQLFALALSRNARLEQTGALGGAWTEADQKLRRYIASARSLQNSDGSFSTIYFRGRDFSYEFNERIKSSGHTLEWLMMALAESDLDETWVRRGIETVSRDLINNANQPADCGPLYHALHSLVLYRQRRPQTPSLPPERDLAVVEPVTPEPVIPEPVTPEPVTPEPVTPERVTARPLTPIRITPEPLTPEVPEQPIKMEDEGVANTTQTVARPAMQDLPWVNFGADETEGTAPETSGTENALPPPPPVTLRYEPDDEPENVVSAPQTGVDTGTVVERTEDDLPPLPPRRPVRAAGTDGGSVIR